jgi:DNA-binding NtrC family response regulator
MVDDDVNFLVSAEVMLRAGGVSRVMTLSDSREVIHTLDNRQVSVVLLDLTMPHVTGLELLEEINEKHPGVSIIIITGTDELEMAVNCMRAGAFDYLVKPVEESRFLASIKRALEVKDLRREIVSLKEMLLTSETSMSSAFDSMVTVSSSMQSLFRYIEAIAPSDQTVLVTGETGVGKELMARAVHDISGREGEFIPVTVAGLDDTMVSDTLFGHEKGAYTGADQSREGLIRRAEGGTLFLDEIGDLAEASQIKLLRLLQEGTYYPLGSDVPRKSTARIVVATHRDLAALHAEGRFRKDLYYRLRFHHVHIPPLRERVEDVPVLLDHFLTAAARSLGKKVPTPPRELATLLANYRFPGNIRELEAMIHDAVARHTSGVLSMKNIRELVGAGRELDAALPETDTGEDDSKSQSLDLAGRLPTLKEAETILIEEAMKRADGNQRIAAELLGISRQALNKRLIRSKTE